MGECILAGHPQGGGVRCGTYTGDGQASRTIHIGVTPKWVFVVNSDGQPFKCKYSSSGNVSYSHYGGLAITGSPASAVSIVDGGFIVAYEPDPYGRYDDKFSNYPNHQYRYIYGT